MSGYPEKAFTVVSTDNLDYVHSYAQVYCGKQQSSWHGTTVQVVQPQPTIVDTSNCIQPLVQGEVATNGETTTSLNTVCHANRHPVYPAVQVIEAPLRGHAVKRFYSNRSPSNSPGKHSPLPKKHRRMRTGTEGVRRNITDQLSSSGSANYMGFQHQSQLLNLSKTFNLQKTIVKYYWN